MRPVSDKFLETLRGSHAATVQAFVVSAGQTGVSPTGTEVQVFDGNVEMDLNADIRSTLDLVTDGLNQFPDNASDLFVPYGSNEVFVRRGILFGGGAIEWVSLGYFRIFSVEQADAPKGAIRIAGQDRMAGIIDGRLLNPVQYPSTTQYGDVVAELVQEIYPWATIEWDDATETAVLGRSVIAEEDRYDFLNELIKSLGKMWYWDYRGILVIKDVPDSDDPVWEVNAGENGVLVGQAREISREGVYNAVKAYGEALDTEAPPSAIAYDNNNDSPTYWNGPFGKVPRFYTSPFITTTAQAQTAATALLKQKLGLPYSVNFASVVNPALEPGDAVTITNPAPEVHVIDRLTVPLAATDVMTADTREQTLVVIGEDS